MRRYNIFYFIGQALSGLWRNGVMSFASIAVLMSCLVVIGGFSLLVMTINENLENFGVLKEIVVYVDTSATEEEVAHVGEQIGKLDNIEKVVYVSKEDGFKELNEQNDVYEKVTDADHLPYRFDITYIDNEKVSELDYQLRQIDGIIKVNNRFELATSLERLKSGVMLVFVWFLVILAIVSVFIIINTVKLSVFARRHEISIMRYVGATGWFISLPFIFEGMIIGLFASFCAYFIEWYIYSYVEQLILTDLPMITVLEFGSISSYVLLGFVALGIVTGIIGSSLSLNKYLRQ